VKLEFLGSAGAGIIPRPGCECPVCAEARERGAPYARTGPALFVHGPDVLVDTSEDIAFQLNRSGLREIGAGLYSHWHPDHVMGRRVWELLNLEPRSWPPETRACTPIYLPAGVAADFREHLGGWEHLTHLEETGVVEIHEVPDGETIVLGETRITPFRLAEGFVYGFVFEEGGRRALVVMDELNGWAPPDWLRGADVAVLPMGVVEHDPFTGERRIDPQHPVLREEATFAETLAIADQLAAARVILSHIEEMDGLSYDDLARVERGLRADGRDLTFAYDTLTVEV
jgi:phosphoribosyl 1,2-cyclic phosphate phosphodiesterase